MGARSIVWIYVRLSLHFYVTHTSHITHMYVYTHGILFNLCVCVCVCVCVSLPLPTLGVKGVWALSAILGPIPWTPGRPTNNDQSQLCLY